jgi:DNA-binding SARP family transcriptional activator
VHRAEASASVADWPRAWGAAHAAICIARREFMADEDGGWIQQWRDHLAQVETRALECYAAASLGIGSSELAAAERAARRLVEKEPYRESGYRLLMETLASSGNDAAAIQVYDELRQLLREQLGMNPSPATQLLHKRLLGAVPNESAS